MTSTDTIVALATARGRAALAIVRLSGPEAVRIVANRFSNAALAGAPSHTAHFGYVLDGEGTRLDQVVVTLFRAPKSATGEDVVEVTCHGGDLAPQLVLKSLLEAGARLAEPGEFTQRAFLNGKLDLTQAEAVADLIHAQSELAHRVSLRHLDGRVAESVEAIRTSLIQTTALIELELDFVEEDVEFADRQQLEQLLAEAETLLTELLDSYRLGALVRDGVRVVIGGRPNAGKSTLLNALVERDRAIVSEIPGTTRDEVEAEKEIGGLLFRFVDTAGLRDTTSKIEAEGVRRTHRAIHHADVLLYVFDTTVGLAGEEAAFLDELEKDRPDFPVLRIANKADLQPVEENEALALSAKNALSDPQLLDALREALSAAVAVNLTSSEGSTIVVNQRHHQHLAAAREAVHRAQQAMRSNAGGETLALDLRAALHELGAITGAITNEDVLDAIFSQFCIGK